MNNVRINVEHNGLSYPGEVMKIESTTLGLEDHGVWVAYLHCSGAGTGVGVGGYVLDTKPIDNPLSTERTGSRGGSAYGMDHIMRLVQTVGVDKWEDLVGQSVIVLFEPNADDSVGFLGSSSVGIANILTGRVFLLKEHAEEWAEAEARKIETLREVWMREYEQGIGAEDVVDAEVVNGS